MLPDMMGVKIPSDYSTFVIPFGPQWTLTRLSRLIYGINTGIKKSKNNSQITFVEIKTKLDFTAVELQLHEVNLYARCRCHCRSTKFFDIFQLLKHLNWMTENPMSQGKAIKN